MQCTKKTLTQMRSINRRVRIMSNLKLIKSKKYFLIKNVYKKHIVKLCKNFFSKLSLIIDIYQAQLFLSTVSLHFQHYTN